MKTRNILTGSAAKPGRPVNGARALAGNGALGTAEQAAADAVESVRVTPHLPPPGSHGSAHGHLRARHHGALGSNFLIPRAWEEIARSLRMSPRELQIVRAIFDNRKMDAIAADLGVSPHTVHSHVKRVFEKLDVTSKDGLILRVFNELAVVWLSADSDLLPPCRHRAAGLCPLTQSPPPFRCGADLRSAS